MSQAFRCNVCKGFQEGVSTDELHQGVELKGTDLHIRVIFMRDGESSIRVQPALDICEGCKVSALVSMVSKLGGLEKKETK